MNYDWTHSAYYDGYAYKDQRIISQYVHRLTSRRPSNWIINLTQLDKKRAAVTSTFPARLASPYHTSFLSVDHVSSATTLQATLRIHHTPNFRRNVSTRKLRYPPLHPLDHHSSPSTATRSQEKRVHLNRHYYIFPYRCVIAVTVTRRELLRFNRRWSQILSSTHTHTMDDGAD